MRKTRVIYGSGATYSVASNLKKAQKIIDHWVAAGDVDMELDLTGLKLEELPKLPNNLKKLYCHNNKLTSLPTLPNSLRVLEFYKNQLTSLPTLPNSLESLVCSRNKLTSLPTLPNSLESLECSENQLTSLPTLPNSLKKLYCSNNQLTSIPILPTDLFSMYCSDNQLTSLPPLPNSLQMLYCENNKLTALPVLPNNLIELEYSGNQLTTVPTLSNSVTMKDTTERPDTLIRLINNIEVPTFKPTDATRLKVSEPVDVFDAIEYSDIPLSIKEITDDKENIYFKIKNTFFRISREYLTGSIKKYDNIIYKCKKSMSGAPRIKDIHEDKPYFLLRTSAIYAVPLEYLKAALQSNDWVYELKEDTNMKFTSSFGSVMAEYGTNYAGRNINIVSADHCQDGSNRQAYTIQTIELVPKESNTVTKGGKRRIIRKTHKKKRY